MTLQCSAALLQHNQITNGYKYSLMMDLEKKSGIYGEV